MFLNILRISVSNALKMFLNIIVSIGCAVVFFHSCKPTGTTNQPEAQSVELAAGLVGRKEIKQEIKLKQGFINVFFFFFFLDERS